MMNKRRGKIILTSHEIFISYHRILRLFKKTFILSHRRGLIMWQILLVYGDIDNFLTE